MHSHHAICWYDLSFELYLNFESSIVGPRPDASESRHHEQTLGYQKHFKPHVTDLEHVMKDLGNPSEEESGDLIRLRTRDLMDKPAADCVATI